MGTDLADEFALAIGVVECDEERLDGSPDTKGVHVNTAPTPSAPHRNLIIRRW